MKTVSKTFGTTTRKPVTESKFLACNSRLVGLECEREEVKIPNQGIESYYITKKTDGSLRNDGAEFVFSEPFNASDVIEAVKELGNIFAKVKPSHSFRTSDHVHIDIGDFDVIRLNVLFKNLIVLEETLYNLGSKLFKRKENSYCMPLSGYIESNLNIANGQEFWYFYLPKYLCFRFCREYGSIEFRLFDSTDSVLELIRRINVCLEVVEASFNLKIINPTLNNIMAVMPKTYGILKPHLKRSMSPLVETDLAIFE